MALRFAIVLEEGGVEGRGQDWRPEDKLASVTLVPEHDSERGQVW